MFKSMTTLAVSIFFTVLTNTVFATEPVNQSELVKQVITAYMEKNRVPGVAVELNIDGKSESYYFGYANVEKKNPVTKETIFELGSISKVMTSLLLAEELDAAKIQLDSPIRKYAPNLPEEFDDVTVQSLATHTSGLVFMPPDNIKTRKDLEQYLAVWYPDYVVDQAWLYSNMGVGILGDALQQEMHQNLNHLFRAFILSPLHMQLIALEVPPAQQKNYAQGYNENNQPVPPTAQGLFPAANGFKVPAGDMQQFLSAAIGLPGTPERILYPMRMTQAAYLKLPGRMQGLGWVIHPISSNDVTALLNENGPLNFGPDAVEVMEQPKFKADTLIDKTGTTAGFRAYVGVIPSKKSGIVIMVNKGKVNNDMVHAAREILFKLTGLMPEPAAPVSVEENAS